MKTNEPAAAPTPVEPKKKRQKNDLFRRPTAAPTVEPPTDFICHDCGHTCPISNEAIAKHRGTGCLGATEGIAAPDRIMCLAHEWLDEKPCPYCAAAQPVEGPREPKCKHGQWPASLCIDCIKGVETPSPAPVEGPREPECIWIDIGNDYERCCHGDVRRKTAAAVEAPVSAPIPVEPQTYCYLCHTPMHWENGKWVASDMTKCQVNESGKHLPNPAAQPVEGPRDDEAFKCPTCGCNHVMTWKQYCDAVRAGAMDGLPHAPVEGPRETKCANCPHSKWDHYLFVGGLCNVGGPNPGNPPCQCPGYRPTPAPVEGPREKVVVHVSTHGIKELPSAPHANLIESSSMPVEGPVSAPIPDLTVGQRVPLYLRAKTIDMLYAKLTAAEERIGRAEARNQWIKVSEKVPPFNKMVWIAAPMWVINRDDSKEYSPFYELACLKDSEPRVWMNSNFEGYTFDEVTHWMPVIPLPEPVRAALSPSHDTGGQNNDKL